jgi:hypothetical protein
MDAITHFKTVVPSLEFCLLILAMIPLEHFPMVYSALHTIDESLSDFKTPSSAISSRV